MSPDRHRLAARRLADRYIGRTGGDPAPGAPNTSRCSRMVLEAMLDDVANGLAEGVSRAHRQAGRLQFAKLRAIVEEDYDLARSPDRGRL